MNQKTRTALYSLAICACVISAASAVILTINARNRKPQAEVTTVEEPQEEEQPKEDRQRRETRQAESRPPKDSGSSGAGDDGAYEV